MSWAVWDTMDVATITRADIEVMHAWGIKLSDWVRLPEHKRAECRANVAQVVECASCWHGERYHYEDGCEATNRCECAGYWQGYK